MEETHNTPQSPDHSQETDNHPGDTEQPVPPVDEAYYESNYSKRLVGGATGVFLILLIVIGLFVIRSIGLQATTFAEASLYDNYATLLKFALAAAAGLTLAYVMYHPIKPRVKYVPVETKQEQLPAPDKNSDTVWIVFIIIGLMFFYIPGLILLGIYMLKKRLGSEKPPSDTGERFRKVLVRPTVGTGTILVAFILGAVPAFIIGIIIGYPLSNHACNLSGSKYC